MAKPAVPLSDEVIAEHLRLAQIGVPLTDACAQLKMSTATYYRWASDGQFSDDDSPARRFYENVVLFRQGGTAGKTESAEGFASFADFRRWASELVIENEENLQLEGWQLDVCRDVLNGTPETWLVVPEGNGKTTLLSALALYHCDRVPNAFVPIGASSRDQAGVMWRQCEGFVLRTPGLIERFKPLEGYRRVNHRVHGGRIQVFAADDRTGDGVIPTLALVDELHRHRDLRLYRTWRGKLVKRGGQIVCISTAGEPGAEFEETRTAILNGATKRTRRGQFIRAEGDGLVLHDWAVRNREEAGNMAVVAKANPRKDITAAVLRDKRASPTMTDEHWLRFTCNIATRESGQAVTPEQWDALYEDGLEPNRAAWCVGWIDLGWKIDTTAMGVLVWEDSDRRVIAGVKVLQPPVDEADIVAGLLELQEEFGCEGWVYDPNAGGRQMAQQLDKGTHPLQQGRHMGPLTFIEHSQENSMMSAAAARFDEALRNGRLVHDGDPDMRAHVLNAYRHPLGGEKWKYDRPPDARGARRAKYPIDALTGVVMGHSIAVSERLERDPAPFVFEVLG